MAEERSEEVTPPSGPSGDLGIPGVVDAQEIGRGGFGIVYRARQVDFGRLVAIKVITTPLDADVHGRFLRERQAIGSLTGQPNIVTVFSAGETKAGLPFIMMEYLPGGSLADRLPHRPYAVDEAVGIMAPICEAVQAAHDKGLLHRDIKPENIFLSSNGHPKLGDFGIAKPIDGSVTTEGMTASLAHAAPELLEGKRPSAASDIYSLGSTLFTLINGTPAFMRPGDESILPLLTRVARDDVPDLRPSGVPDAVCTVLEQSMAKDPGARPASAAAFAEQLRAALTTAGTAVTSRPTERVPRPSPPPVPPPETGPRTGGKKEGGGRRLALVSIGIGIFVLLAIALAVVALTRGSETDAPEQATPAEAPGDVAGTPGEDAPLLFRPPGDVRYAVAATDGIYSSADGATFTKTLEGGPMYQVAAGEEGWLAVGAGGAYFSIDGRRWEQVSDESNLHAVATDGQRWVVAGASGRIGASADGRSFSVARLPTDESMNGVTTDGTTWVVVGSGGYIATSADGQVWRTETSGVAADLNAVARTADGWLAVGQDGIILWSADAVTWQRRSISDDHSLSALAPGDPGWIVAGVALYRSDDGTEWTKVPSDFDGYVETLRWDGERYVALTQKANFYTSDDGLLWSIASAAAGPPGEGDALATTIVPGEPAPVTLYTQGLGVAAP